MPPKLNKEAVSASPVAAGDEPDEEEKQLVENALVVRYIKSRLSRYQESEERLSVENARLDKELHDQKADFTDIREYLQRQVANKTTKIEELEKCKAALEEELEQTKSAFKSVEERLQKENASLKSALQEQIQKYNKKVKGSQDYLEQNERLEAELAALKASAEKERREQQIQLSDMERSHLRNRETWKRETAQKVKEAKMQMIQLTDNQLESTTKRTILENEQMATELGYQSRQTEKMLHRHDRVLEENAEMKMEIQLAREAQDELARRNLTYQHALQKLLDRIVIEKSEMERHLCEKRQLSEQLREEKERMACLVMTAEEQKETIRDLAAQARHLEESTQEAAATKDDVVGFLKQCVEDITKKKETVETDKDSGQTPIEAPLAYGRLVDLSESQRLRALNDLLSRLREKSASGGCARKKRIGFGETTSRCPSRKANGLPEISPKTQRLRHKNKELSLADFADNTDPYASNKECALSIHESLEYDGFPIEASV